jgi:CheY-like chemotaxis protein
MWEKIVLNLLSNAFKFTFQGSITVSLEEEAEQVLLKVRDTGVGIAEDEQPRIFERFYRAEHSKGRSFEGSGIGLALIQELVKLHGGTIGFTSRMGQGTEFTVTIPLGNDHLPKDRIKGPDSPAVAIQNRQAVIKEAEKWVPESDSQVTRAQSSTTDSDSRPHVLLVDDNLDMRTYIHKILSPKYDVTLAKDGQEALEKVREHIPDLILSDVMMPRLDGFGLIQQLHADHATKGIPVILLSARAGDEAKIEGLGQGKSSTVI